MHTLLAQLLTWFRPFAVGPQFPLVWRGGQGLTLGRDDSTFSDPIAFTRSTPAWNGGAGGGAGSGAGDSGQGDAGGAAGTPPATPPAGATTTATAGTGSGPDLAALQTSLDAAKRDGQTEASKAMLGALGFDKLEDAQAWVTAQREKENASLSELERREKAAEERERAAAEREANANRIALQARITTALTIAGAPAEHVGDLVPLIAVADDADDAAIAAAVEAKKAKFPALFAAATASSSGSGTRPATTAPFSLPAGGGRSESGGDAQPLDAGRQRAKQLIEQRTAANSGSFPFPAATS